jgi:hypothetical protein
MCSSDGWSRWVHRNAAAATGILGAAGSARASERTARGAQVASSDGVEDAT